MKEFNIERSCKKCGFEGKKVVDENRNIVFSAAAKVQYMPPVKKDNKPECILRTCKRCGYGWVEHCIDG